MSGGVGYHQYPVENCVGRDGRGKGEDAVEVPLVRLEMGIGVMVSHQHVKGIGDIACAESLHVVRIDGIAQAELLTDSHLRRRTADDIWKGLYEFPLTESERELTETELRQAQRRWLPLEKPLDFKMSSPYRHQLTHQLLHVRFLELQLSPDMIVHDCESVPYDLLGDYPVPQLLARYGPFFVRK